MRGGGTGLSTNKTKPKRNVILISQKAVNTQADTGNGSRRNVRLAPRDETRQAESRLFSGIGLAFNQSRPAKQINNQSQSHQLCGETTSASSTVHCRLFACLITASTQHFSVYLFIVFRPPSLAPFPTLYHSWSDTLKRRTILSMLIILIGATWASPAKCISISICVCLCVYSCVCV